jgi:hypothetical protein
VLRDPPPTWTGGGAFRAHEEVGKKNLGPQRQSLTNSKCLRMRVHRCLTAMRIFVCYDANRWPDGKVYAPGDGCLDDVVLKRKR